MATPPFNRKVYCFGVFELDARAGKIRKGGSRIKLQPQPLKVLLAVGRQKPELMLPPAVQFPSDASGDGKYLALCQLGRAIQIEIASIQPTGKPAVVREMADRMGRHANPHFSPATPCHSQRWLADDILQNEAPE